MSTFPTARERRLRRTPRLRRAVADTRLHPASFVLPVFVVPGSGVERPIGAMPGHAQLPPTGPPPWPRRPRPPGWEG